MAYHRNRITTDKLKSLKASELLDLVQIDSSVAIRCAINPDLAKIMHESCPMAMWAAMSFPGAAIMAVANLDVAKLNDSEGKFTVAHVAAFSYSSVAEIIYNNTDGRFDQVIKDTPDLIEKISLWTKDYDVRASNVKDTESFDYVHKLLVSGSVWESRYIHDRKKLDLYQALRKYRTAKHVAEEYGYAALAEEAQEKFNVLRDSVRYNSI